MAFLVLFVLLVFRILLRGFSFSADLFLDLPVGKQILMTAAWALPRPFYRIGTAFVEHLHNQVTMQTHGWVAQDQFPFCRLLSSNCHIQPPVKILGSFL